MTTQLGVTAALIHSGKLATIGAPRPIQIEWLDKIAAATHKVRLHINDAAALDQVNEAIEMLRLQLGSPELRNDEISSGWLQIIVGLLIVTHGMDDCVDTGEIIEVFSQLVGSCAAA